MTPRELSCVVTVSIICCVSNAQSIRFAAAVPRASAAGPNSLSSTQRAIGRGKSILKLRGVRHSQPESPGASLDSESDYVGPSDPANPSKPLICNLAVRKAIDSAWSSSVQAAHRPPTEFNSKVEFGFAINANSENNSLELERIQTSDRTDSRPNELKIPVTENTIATVHTHNTGARSSPSATDVKSYLPAFVKSDSYVFVTIPGTNRYAEVELKKVCRGN